MVEFNLSKGFTQRFLNAPHVWNVCISEGLLYKEERKEQGWERGLKAGVSRLITRHPHHLRWELQNFETRLAPEDSADVSPTTGFSYHPHKFKVLAYKMAWHWGKASYACFLICHCHFRKTRKIGREVHKWVKFYLNILIALIKKKTCLYPSRKTLP